MPASGTMLQVSVALQSLPPEEPPRPAAPSPQGEPGPRKRRPFEGWGSAIARALALAGRALARVSVLFFGHVRSRSERAVSEFQKKDRHSRYRAYALGSYGCIAAITLLAQLYHSNSIAAYVRAEKIDFPKSTTVFVRNDSDQPWTAVKVTLNGKYTYERLRLDPGDNFQVRVDRFAIAGKHGSKGFAFAPPDTVAHTLTVECDRGRFEKRLGDKQ